MDFESHRAAALARRILVPGLTRLFNLSVIKQVDWANPDMEGVIMEPQRKKIFIKNYPQFVSEEAIRAYFNDLCQGRVQYVMTGPTYGFITFQTHHAANLVMERKDDLRLAGMKLTIDWWVTKKRDSDGSDDHQHQPRPVLTPSKHSVNRPPAPPQQITTPRPLEELLHLTRVRGWGDPQYRLTSQLDQSRSPVFQYSVTFSAVPFKICGEESYNKHQAFLNCAQMALGAISKERVPSPVLAAFKYIPHCQYPSRQPANLFASALPNLTNLRI